MINLTKIKSIKKSGTKNLVFNKASDIYNKLLSYLNFNIHFFSMKKKKEVIRSANLVIFVLIDLAMVNGLINRMIKN